MKNTIYVWSGRAGEYTTNMTIALDAVSQRTENVWQAIESGRKVDFAKTYGFTLTEANTMNRREFSDELTTEEAEASMAAYTWSHDIPTAANS